MPGRQFALFTYYIGLFVSGIRSMVTERNKGQSLIEDDQNEETWGFVQIRSVLLLSLSTLVGAEVYYGDSPSLMELTRQML